jgi:hypothetical protein
MIPSGWMFLDHLPLNLNGKIDRKRLPKCDLSIDKNNIIPPSQPFEQELLEEWIIVFKRNNISVTHDFFSDLSGNSLIGMTLVSKMQKRIGRRMKIGFNDLLDKSTIRTLAAHINSKIKS